MLETLASGKLHGKPQERESRDGKHRFVVAKLRCAGGDGESLFMGIAAFSDSVKAALLALDDGEPLAVVGALRVGIWKSADGKTRPQLDLTASAVLTPHHVRRKRAAVQGEAAQDTTRHAEGSPGSRLARGEPLREDSLDDAF